MKTLYTLLLTLFVTFNINAQIIDFPDANFKAALIADGVDTNSDGEIQVSEAEARDELRVDNQSISSMEGIEYFVNMLFLDCSDNLLTEIDISALTNLDTLDCSYNQLTSLNLGSVNLIELHCGINQLTSLDLSSATNLESLGCYGNQLTALDLSNQTETLQALDCYSNNLTTLDVESLTMLTWLTCDDNQLTSLNLNSTSIWLLSATQNQLTNIDTSSLPDLLYLHISDNLLTNIDISNNGILRQLTCRNNQLASLNLKNGAINYNFAPVFDEFYLEFEDNPNLEFICVDYGVRGLNDEYEIDVVQDLIDTYGYTNCYVSSYCSFVPGGTFYTIEGATRLDLDANGCDVADNVYPHLNFSTFGSVTTGNYISDPSGDYTIPVQAGTRTITPILENPDYFTVSPTEITVSFPTDPSPFVQDFCITPNGTYHDLEITLIPTEAARPGFNTNYKLIYKNKGTTTLSGTIDLNFMDAIMDFVSASPSEDSQSSGVLNWNFSNLTPLESREIFLTMTINTPTDAPPVNGGDVLEFTATVNSSETDETPDDNLATLNQTVVNSYDPNDKTCLEGEAITPEMVGKYVHYMIRFENTGTANAINIVVKDDIDTSKYDLSTLVPIDASHDFFARIKDQGSSHYVEFIFENINLPFDDANNDGYVAFKIKTLNSLQLGDTFENNAEIYFDYNFPIITNVAQTTVATLSVDEFELANSSIVLYPNPTTNLLHIDAQQNIQHVSIYDVSGRLIQSIGVIGLKTNLEISTENLTSGSYFVKIESENGTVVRKVIKD